MPVFNVSEFESLSEIIYCHKKRSFICMDKNDVLSLKSFQNIMSFGKGFSLIQPMFNEDNENIEIWLKKFPVLLPFYFNFLHIAALFDNKFPFHFTKFGKINIPISYFLQLDFLSQTCVDIVLKLKFKSLLKTYMQHLINSLKDNNTTFYEKLRIFAYDYNFEQNNSIYPFFLQLLSIFEHDTTIVSEFVDLSYMDIDPVCFYGSYSCDELVAPKYIVIENVSDLRSEDALKNVLSPKLQYLSQLGRLVLTQKKKQADIKCKVCLLKGFTEINDYSQKLHKKIMRFNPENQLFSNKIFQMLIKYKWETYARRCLLQEFIAFLIIFFIYLANNIYILPIRNVHLNDEFGNKYDTIALALEICIITYFTYYALREILQMKNSGFSAYFSSPWNICDLILIPLTIAGASLDIYQISLKYSYISSEKIIYSVTLLIFWGRILSYSRAFEGTGFMIRLVIQVILDMKYFLFLIILFTLAFTSSGYMLQVGFQISQWDSFILFYRLMLGDFTLYDANFVDVENSTILWIIMILFTLLLSVIMLNLLISIIGETFSKVRAAESSMKYYELYSIIIEIDNSMSQSTIKKMREERKIGNYLICLYNEDSQFEKKELRNEIFLMENTKKIERDVIRVSDEVVNLNKELKEFKKHIYEDLNEIKSYFINEKINNQNNNFEK